MEDSYERGLVLDSTAKVSKDKVNVNDRETGVYANDITDQMPRM